MSVQELLEPAEALLCSLRRIRSKAITATGLDGEVLVEQGELLDHLREAVAVQAQQVKGVPAEVRDVVDDHHLRAVRLRHDRLAGAHDRAGQPGTLGEDLTHGLALGVEDLEVIAQEAGHLVDDQHVMVEEAHASMAAPGRSNTCWVMWSAIGMAEVAVGEGALQTCSIRGVCRKWKSSTMLPSARTAWARMPGG